MRVRSPEEIAAAFREMGIEPQPTTPRPCDSPPAEALGTVRPFFVIHVTTNTLPITGGADANLA